MKKVLSLLALATLVGCGYSSAAQRSESVLTYDDGYHPVVRTTATNTGDSSRWMAGLVPAAPIVSAARLSYGYGPGVYPGTYANGPYAPGTYFAPASGCQVNPYLCPTWVSTPVVVNGGPLAPVMAPSDQTETASAQASAAPGGKTVAAPPVSPRRLSAVEKRLNEAETKIHALAKLSAIGVTVNEAWCKGFLKHPKTSGLEPADIDGAKAACNEYLGQPTAVAKKK